MATKLIMTNSRGRRARVAYWVDDKQPEFAVAKAASDQVVLIELKDSADLFNAFRCGQTLHVNAQSTNLAFNLTNTSQVLTYILKCASANGTKPEFAVAGNAADRAIDRHVTRRQAGPKDQVTATRRTLKQMNEAADRAIDDQAARSTPMTPKR